MKPLGILLTVAMLLLLVVAPASADPPITSGIVTRGETEAYFINCDPDTGLCGIYGLAGEDFCNGVPNFDFFDFQEITLPQHDDALRILQHLQGDGIRAEVYRVEDVPCNGPPIATGTVKLNYTDNDVYQLLNSANTWGMTAHGKVFAPDGTRMQLSAMFRYVVSPDGTLRSWIRKVQLS